MEVILLLKNKTIEVQIILVKQSIKSQRVRRSSHSTQIMKDKLMTLNLTIMVQEFPRVIHKVLSKSARWKETQLMINKSSYKTMISKRILHTMAHAGKLHGHILSLRIY